MLDGDGFDATTSKHVLAARFKAGKLEGDYRKFAQQRRHAALSRELCRRLGTGIEEICDAHSGKLKSRSEWRNGQLTGAVTKMNVDGKVLSIQHFENGSRVYMPEENLTPDTAYLAIYKFLTELYQRTNSDELGWLLGSMSYLADGETADPAVWKDWMHCVAKVLDGRGDAELRCRLVATNTAGQTPF